MEKKTSLSYDENTFFAANTTSVAALDDRYCHQDIAADFSSMYNFIFPPKSPLPYSLSLTPSSCSSSSSGDGLHVNLELTSDTIATEYRLNQARLVLEYRQLCDHYDLCFGRLQALIREIETLRKENSDLVVANFEMMKHLSLSSIAAMNNRSLQRNEVQNSVYLPSEKRREKKAIELDVYNQGMVKTELCNKWQEIGSCPYGDHCQFAHGITELRPVVRHPRYKTQVCQMVLAGETCPYGHRCHFRHSLTQQERQLIPR